MKPKYILIAILILGAVLRFWGLGSQEFYHDEGLYAFRSIGYLDYLQNDDQTTPVQWFKDSPSLPWWTGLSFHDAPPLFFIFQNFIFRIFGDSLFAARLLSAISGLFSIYFLYLISKKIFKKEIVRLFAPLLLSINLIHIWISRSSLLESFQISLILLSIYLFLRFLEEPERWFLFGVTLGLNFLTKYTGVFLILVYGIYLLFFRKEIYKRRELYFALALATIMFLPVIVYNFYLWKTTGHFDLQFSYLFSRETPEWRVSLGKIQDPFSEIFSNLQLMYSIPFLLLTMAGIGYAIFQVVELRRSRPTEVSLPGFWLLNLIFITLMLIKVGSAFRFIVLYAAPTVMLIAYLFDYLFSKFNKRILFRVLLIVFLIYELFFGMDIFRTFPDFGIVKLDQYLDSELGDKRPLSIPASSNQHLEKIIRNYALKIPAADTPIMIIYDENVGLSPRLWLFTRRNYYHGIPVATVDQFKKFLRERGAEAFRGYQFYFVKASDKTYLNPLYFNPSAQEFEIFLRNDRNLSPVKTISGYNNLLMFTVYKFKL